MKSFKAWVLVDKKTGKFRVSDYGYTKKFQVYHLRRIARLEQFSSEKVVRVEIREVKP